ncbi:MAG: hypothetical protein V7K94_14945 [Nostoc sp.]|uniref:hypothetical protein n=1 Tax=Nostoc sp. TaxID=1180 RepID=UPI002FF4B9D9
MSKTGIDSNADIASAVVVTTLKGAVGCDRYKEAGAKAQPLVDITFYRVFTNFDQSALSYLNH